MDFILSAGLQFFNAFGIKAIYFQYVVYALGIAVIGLAIAAIQRK